MHKPIGLSARTVVVVFISSLLSPIAAVLAQCEIDTLTAGGVGANDKFGFAVAISGDYAIVGAHHPDGMGAAYVFKRNGLNWVEVTTLEPPGVTIASDDEYGRAVALDGDVAVVGARQRTVTLLPPAPPIDVSSAGAAYVFRRDAGGTWVYEGELRALIPDQNDEFGYGVTVSGDRIAVGAPNEDGPSPTVSDSGTVYAFEYDGVGSWDFGASLRASDPGASDSFGRAVSMDGDRLLVGAELDDLGAGFSGVGSAYVFRWNAVLGWVQEVKLTAQTDSGDDDFHSGDKFGRTVSIDGDRLAIGASQYDGVGSNSGAAYVYAWDADAEEWVIEKKLTAVTPTSGFEFGKSVAIDGDLILVGARDDPAGIDRAGAAYLFRKGVVTWEWVTTFDNSAPAEKDFFGDACALDGDFAVVGAFGDDSNGIDSGAAYAFWVTLVEYCFPDDTADVCQIIDGTLADDNANGIPDRCECEPADPCHEDPDLACTIDFCDDETHLCTHDISPGFCAIIDECHTAGTPRPDFPCQECNPSLDPENWSPRPDGEGCTDDNNACTGDVCAGGVCTHPNVTAGVPCGDTTDDDCTNPDTCDGVGVCVPNHVVNGTACASDSDDCTDDVCQTGTCEHPFSAAGAPCGDSTDDDCNDPNTCDGAGVCVDNLVADDTPCTDDGLFCTGEETCQGGVCESSGDPCEGTPGLTCNQAAEDNDVCSCSNNEACADTLPCTTDTCNPTTGLCERPIDAGFCVIDDTCHDDLTVRPGFECQWCNAAENQEDWANKPADTACTDDGAFCTGEETCQGGECVSSGDPCADDPGLTCDANAEANDTCSCSNNDACADALPCTTDSCNFATGLCENTIDSGFCLIDGTCYADDDEKPGNKCQACDSQINQESWIDRDDGAPCENGQFCDGADTCLAGVCMHDGDPCVDLGLQCNEQADLCGCDDDGDCPDDGLFCNGPGICDLGNNECVDAGDPCSGAKPFCDEEENECLECRTDDHCDNRWFCDGAETCGDDGACVAGTPPCPNLCDEPSDQCVDCLGAADCDDGDPCTLDLCPGGECEHTLQPWCVDSDGDGITDVDDLCPDTTWGVVIDEFGCEIPGACCLHEGCLQELELLFCEELLEGIYAGAGTDCEDEVCVPGACCLPLGDCAEFVEMECVAQGGVFQGPGIPCDVIECPVPPGACCVEHVCVPGQPRFWCLSVDGDWAGPATECFEGLCPLFDDGDIDKDRDVDLDDFAVFQDCFGAEGSGECRRADLDGNDVIDLRDFERFYLEMMGPGLPDTDGDGVADHLDLCPDTPPGVDVDEAGCAASQRDSDIDGVTDDLDQCPETPLGQIVDSTGCPTGQLSNDDCGSPVHVSEHTYGFSNVGATTDGPEACSVFGFAQIDSDIWYCHTATRTEAVIVSLCGSLYDTKLAVYEGCECPTVADPWIACSDDDCAAGQESRAFFPAVEGQQYMLRVGGFFGNGQEQGTGTLTIFRESDDGHGVATCRPGSGDCFAPNGTPGCELVEVCLLTCAADPFCCDTEWDELCAKKADGIANGFATCAPDAGSCFEANGTAGCDDQDCCQVVCTADPFCCMTEWDFKCVEAVPEQCGLFAACIGARGSCHAVHATAGCEVQACCEAVCAIDAVCCDVEGEGWDEVCVGFAESVPECPP